MESDRRHKFSVLSLMNGICAFSNCAVGRFETSAKQGDGMTCGLRCHPQISISSCIMKKMLTEVVKHVPKFRD